MQHQKNKGRLRRRRKTHKMENLNIDLNSLKDNKNGAAVAIVLIVGTALVALGKKALETLG